MQAADSSWNHWRTWLRNSVNGRILSAMLIVGGLSLVVNVAVVARELVLAAVFGVGDAVDAFLIAFALPAFAMNVLAGSIGAALVPLLIRVREESGPAAVRNLLASTTCLAAVILLLVAGVLGLSGPLLLPWLGSNFTPAKLALTYEMYLWLLAPIVLHGINRVWAAVLNAHEQFGVVAVSPIVIPIVSVGLLLAFHKQYGVRPLAWGAVVGYVLETLWIARGLWKLGYPISFRWGGLTPEVRSLAAQYGALTGGAALMSGIVLVNQSMAAALPSGSVSALNYGNKLVTFLVGLGNLAVGSAVLPHFSKMVATADWPALRRTLRLYAGLIVAVTVPVTFLLCLQSRAIVSIIYERGEFTAASSEIVARVQTFAFAQVPFQVLGILGVRLLSACSRNDLLLLICGLNLAVTAIANALLIRTWGVVGISLGTSVMYAISTVCIFVALTFELRRRSAA